MHGTWSIVESEQNTMPIESVGAEIKARIEAGNKSLEKAGQHYIAAGIQLQEAKARLRETGEMTWPAFLNQYCNVRRRRADELISLAEGRITLDELREQNRERVSAHRERKKSELALRNAERKAIATESVENRSALMRAWQDAGVKERQAFLRAIRDSISDLYVPKDWLESAAVALHHERGTDPSDYLRKKYWYSFGDNPPPEPWTEGAA